MKAMMWSADSGDGDEGHDVEFELWRLKRRVKYDASCERINESLGLFENLFQICIKRCCLF